jgi:hypothetical protein
MNHHQISSHRRPLVAILSLPRPYARNLPRCGAVGREIDGGGVGGEIDPIARRGLLVGLLACTVTPAVSLLSAQKAVAAAAAAGAAGAAGADAPSAALSVETYTDAIDGWRIDVPSAWTKGEGSLGDKKVDRFSNAAGAY